MSKSNKVIAILCSDIHLSMKAPIYRSKEPNWFEAMKRPLQEIRNLQDENDACPVLCAGDIFDKWNSPPELINFAITNLPYNLITIPGQHDLPLHNFDDIRKSAYWTLFKAGKIVSLCESVHYHYYSAHTKGFPFGKKINKLTNPYDGMCIAMIHEYTWLSIKNRYTNAPEENKLSQKIELDKNNKWLGYDVVVIGDNHIGFSTKVGNTAVFNCGGLMRRSKNDIHRKPMVGLLYEDGSIKKHFLNTSKDIYLEESEIIKIEKTNASFSSFIKSLDDLKDTNLDFENYVKQLMKEKKVNDSVKRLILSSIE